ncbi:MAG: diheme cytochrome c [Azoarcus sp.]|nr:diheme cytochrome c [Azoarcus sp.]
MNMNTPIRPFLSAAMILAVSAFALSGASADGNHFFAPVADKLTANECGSCHMAFPPSMLPAASWQKMMGQLDQHFGEDASIDADTAALITRYLSSNAGDASGLRFSGKLLRDIAPGAAPQRITELPRWKREHRKISTAEWADPKVQSKANCGACHADAERGYFDDD